MKCIGITTRQSYDHMYVHVCTKADVHMISPKKLSEEIYIGTINMLKFSSIIPAPCIQVRTHSLNETSTAYVIAACIVSLSPDVRIGDIV